MGLVACGARGGDTGVDPAADPVVTPWVYERAPAPLPAFDAATLGPALTEALGAVRALDPALGFAAYEAAAARTDGVCPGYDPAWQAPFHYWEDDCVTSADEHFYGWVLSRTDRDVPSGSARCDKSFYFGFSRVGPSGADLWSGWGELSSEACRDEGTGDLRRAATFKGDFRSDAAAGTWLAEALTLDLAVETTETPAGRAITLSGGLSGLPGDVPAVWFLTLSIADAGGAAGCAAEPTGTLLAWDRAGVGYALTFDDVAAADPACDGCGALTIADVPAGEVCLDGSDLLAWPAP